MTTTEPTDFALEVRIEPPSLPPRVGSCDDRTLDASAGGRFVFDVSELADSHRLSCGDLGAVDAALRLVLDRPRDVFVRTPDGIPLFQAATVAISSDCARPSAERICWYRDVRSRALPAGTWFILLEPESSGQREIVVDVEIRDPVPAPTGDLCTGAVLLTPGTSQRIDLDPVRFDVGTVCDLGADRDAFVRFTLTEPADVSLRVGFDDVTIASIALVRSCDAPREAYACHADFAAATTQRVRSLPAGDWIGVISTGGGGPATARLDLSPATPLPPGDRCDDPVPLAEGSPAVIDFAGAGDDISLCAGVTLGRPDVVARVVLAERRRVTATARPLGTSGHVTMAFHRRCSATDVACDNPLETDRAEAVLDAGEWDLVIEPESTLVPATQVEIRYVTGAP